MEIYLIRHGETDGNLGRRHQQEDSRLTARGKAQAAAAAAACVSYRPTHLIVSSRVRAIETGQYIVEATGLVPEVNPLFMELCRPWHLYGNFHRGSLSLWYMTKWFFGFTGGSDCGEAGESYRTFHDRLRQAKRHLEALPEDAVVVVVSHSIFINFFLALIRADRPIPWYFAPVLLYRVLTIQNGSISRLTYRKDGGTSWQHHKTVSRLT